MGGKVHFLVLQGLLLVVLVDVGKGVGEGEDGGDPELCPSRGVLSTFGSLSLLASSHPTPRPRRRALVCWMRSKVTNDQDLSICKGSCFARLFFLSFLPFLFSLLSSAAHSPSLDLFRANPVVQTPFSTRPPSSQEWLGSEPLSTTESTLPPRSSLLPPTFGAWILRALCQAKFSGLGAISWLWL